MDPVVILWITSVLIQGVVALRATGGRCPTVTLKGGRVRYRYQRGGLAKFMCNPGHTLAGEKFGICSKGHWENSPPKCVRPTCKQPTRPPPNALVFPSHQGGVLNFYCMPGFALIGARALFCEGGERWDQAAPTCTATNSTPPLFCDFEDADLCGWNHDYNHDFDWLRMNFKTPSGLIGTGPQFDHTKGSNNDGYYVYIESSSRNPNDTARLISPVYEKHPYSDVCFEFFYHMWGREMGTTLRAYVKFASSPWNFTRPFFELRGNQGNRWLRSRVNLGPMREDFQIVVEGVRGDSYISDVAIDDVRVILDCVEEEEVTSTESTSSEIPLAVESCNNRCYDSDNVTMTDDGHLMTCDCDDGCVDRGRCCPDYFDLCGFNTTVGPDMASSTTLDFTSSPSPSSTRDIDTTMETVTTTTHKETTMATRRLPPLIIATPPTTVAMYEMTATGHIVYVTSSGHDDIGDDSNDVPVVTVDNDDVIISVAVPEEKERHSQKIIIAKAMEPAQHHVIFAVGVVFGVLIALVGVAFAVSRVYKCRGRSDRNHGDSTSDRVSFFPRDDTLDFNLATDDDDDL